MTNPTLERAEKALRDEVERQVQAQGSYSGPENERPDYVDAYLDYPSLLRAVLMAVREPDNATCEAGNDADYYSSEGCDINFLNMDRNGDKPATGIVFTAMIDAILNDGEGE